MAWLEGPRRKLDRADEHLRCLEAQMREQLEPKEYTVTRETETKRTEDAVVTRLREMRFLDPPDLPPDWALLIGDVASNARAALDHLAWQLALLNDVRKGEETDAGRNWPPENTEFPIYSDISDPRVEQRLKGKLSYFLPPHAKIIEDEQPYKRGKLAYAQTLWMLHRIRNTDAHRTLHAVLASVPFSVIEETHSVGSLHEEVKKLTARLAAGDVLQATLKIETNLSPFVTFDQRGAVFHGQEVLPLLHRCRDEVERILGLF